MTTISYDAMNANSNIEATPINNMGVPHTSERLTALSPSERSEPGQVRLVAPLLVTFDWVGITFPDSVTIPEVFTLIGIPQENFEHVDLPLMRYRDRYEFGHIKVLMHGCTENMGTHVLLSGQAVREFEGYHKDGVDWRAWFNVWRVYGGRCTRLDVAMDDKAEDMENLRYDLEEIEQAVREGNYVGKLRTPDFRWSRKKRNMRAGRTVYLGSSTSMLRVRWYDKGVEQGTYEAWNRCELQMRNGKAEAFITEYLKGEEVGALALGVLKDSVRFVIPSDDTNRARWKVCGWWTAFLGDVSACSLTVVHKVLDTIEDKVVWMAKQVSRTVAMVSQYFGGLDWLKGIYQVGCDKLREKDYRMLEIQKQLDELRTKICESEERKARMQLALAGRV